MLYHLTWRPPSPFNEDILQIYIIYEHNMFTIGSTVFETKRMKYIDGTL